jgi:DNA-binding Xre family transcriptional regulator
MRKVRLRIKEVAHEKGISIHRLHLRTEIALSSIRRFYQDPYAEIKLGTLARIADVLNVSICELFEEYEE